VTTTTAQELPGGDTRKDFMKDNARRALVIGAFLMPMLSFRILGKSTATTESGLTLSDLFFFFSIVMLAISVKRKKLPPTRVWYIGVAFVVVGGLLATFHAQAWVQSVFVVARMIFVLLMWQWTMRHLVDDDDRMHAVITAYILGCVVSAAVAVIQLEAHQLISFGTLFKGRSTGLAKHPDDTGSLLALGLAFAVGQALNRARKHNWLFVVSAIVIGMGLICTGSVSGMITALLGAVVAMALGGVSAKQVLVIIGVVAIAYIAGVAVQGSNGKSLNPIQRFTAATGSTAGGSNSVGPRIGTWKGSWHGIVNSPILGHGMDVISGITYTDPNNNTPEETHDFVLMGWYQGGIFFLIGEFICIAEGIRRMFLRGRRDPYRTVLVAGGVTVFAFALQAPMLFDRYFWLPFVLATTYPMLKDRVNGSNGKSVGPPHAEFT
jgi:hypothetical protein